MNKRIESELTEVVCQPWDRSSSGEREPDGVSLHLTHGALNDYLQVQREQMPKDAPNSYSWISPYIGSFITRVSPEVYEQIIQSDAGGIRVYEPCDFPEVLSA